MTRVNVIPADVMFDEWVGAHCREGLRPINKLKDGKYSKPPITKGEYRLSTGHELFCAGHCTFTLVKWKEYKTEWDKRGGKGFDFSPSLDGIPASAINDYVPTIKDYRHNLARLCERFRKRSKVYHYKGKVINTNKDFLLWLKSVKIVLNVNKTAGV